MSNDTFSLIISALAFCVAAVNPIYSEIQRRGRQLEFQVAAWSALRDSIGKEGNLGQNDALRLLLRYKSDLTGANLDGAVLSGVEINNLNARSIIFRNTKLNLIRFEHDALISSDFFNAEFDGVEIKDTSLPLANMSQTHGILSLHNVSLMRSTFNDAEIITYKDISADLSASDLSGSKIFVSTNGNRSYSLPGLRSRSVKVGNDLIVSVIGGDELESLAGTSETCYAYALSSHLPKHLPQGFAVVVFTGKPRPDLCVGTLVGLWVQGLGLVPITIDIARELGVPLSAR